MKGSWMCSRVWAWGSTNWDGRCSWVHSRVLCEQVLGSTQGASTWAVVQNGHQLQQQQQQHMNSAAW